MSVPAIMPVPETRSPSSELSLETVPSMGLTMVVLARSSSERLRLARAISTRWAEAMAAARATSAPVRTSSKSDPLMSCREKRSSLRLSSASALRALASAVSRSACADLRPASWLRRAAA